MVMFCTDDCHPDDFVRGHINLIVKRALADGYDLWDVLQAASVNAQKHYNQNWGLLQAGDPATFITVDRITPNFRVEMTVIRGEEVFNYNASLPSRHDLDDHILDFDFPNNFVATPISEKDIDIDLKPGDTVHVIHASDGSLLTDHEEVVLTGNPLFDSRYPWTEVQKIVVYNRYVPSVKPVVGLVSRTEPLPGRWLTTVIISSPSVLTMYSWCVPSTVLSRCTVDKWWSVLRGCSISRYP